MELDSFDFDQFFNFEQACHISDDVTPEVLEQPVLVPPASPPATQDYKKRVDEAACAV
jgi:hypothetical protein